MMILSGTFVRLTAPHPLAGCTGVVIKSDRDKVLVRLSASPTSTWAAITMIRPDGGRQATWAEAA